MQSFRAVKAAFRYFLLLQAVLSLNSLSGRAAADGVVLEISTEPSGATLFVDNREIGKTPVRSTGDIEPGFHKIRLELLGYKTFARELEVTSVLRLNFRMEVDFHPAVPSPAPSLSPTAAVPLPKASPPAPSPELKRKPPHPPRRREALPETPIAPLETAQPEEPPAKVEPPRFRSTVLALSAGYSTANFGDIPGSPYLRLLIGAEQWLFPRLALRARLGVDPSAGTRVPAVFTSPYTATMGGYETSLSALVVVYQDREDDFILGASWLYWIQHYEYNQSNVVGDTLWDDSEIYRGSCAGLNLIYRHESHSANARDNPFGYQAEAESRLCSGTLANGITGGIFIRF